MQLSQGYTRLQPGVYLQVIALIALPTALAITALAMGVHALVNQKFVGPPDRDRVLGAVSGLEQSRIRSPAVSGRSSTRFHVFGHGGVGAIHCRAS